jgi:pimeloyl-ACP methyl ester carboxylesterase
MTRNWWFALLILLLAGLVVVWWALRIDTNPLDDAARTQAYGSFVALSEGRTHFEDFGNGQPVVLVHGFSAPAFIWDPTFAALTAADFRVLRYDLYGRGYSDRPDATYDLSLFIRQLDELLLAAGIPEPVHLVGLSMGGLVVSAFTAEYPERVGRVVLINPFNRRISIGVMRVPGLGEFLADVYAMRRLPGEFAHEVPWPDQRQEWLDAYREQMTYRGFRHALLSTAREIIDHDPLPIYEDFAQTGPEVLVIAGTHDTLTPYSASERLAGMLGARLVTLPGVEHLAHEEKPLHVHNTIVDFLRP